MQFYINLNSAKNFAKFSQELDLNKSRRANMSSSLQPYSGETSSADENRNQNDQLTTISHDSDALAEANRGVKFDSQSSKSTNEPNRHQQQQQQQPKQSTAKPDTNNKQSSGEKRISSGARQGHSGRGRPFDVIIFAASGSVGRFLVEEMALVVDKHYSSSSSSSSSDQVATTNSRDQLAEHSMRRRSVPSSSKSNGDIRWAVAGRSAVRLSEALCRAELSTGIKNLSSSVPIILADLNHQRSLLDMCEKAHVVVNCAGPYSDLGAEILIRACIECATNYIDLAHETTFIEMINQKYSERARRRGVFILNGCGFQSMSAEMGLNFTKQVADGRIEQVKIILSLSDTKSLSRLSSKSSGIVSEGMWNALLTEKAQEVTVEQRLQLRSKSPNLRRPSVGYEVQDLAHYNQETSDLMRQTIPPPSSGSGSDDDHDGAGGEDSLARAEIRSRSLFERKDTRSLVQDIIQFRNRNVSTLAWPLQFIRNFQSQRGRGYCWPIDNLTGDESQLIRGEMNNYEVRRPDFESTEGWRPIRCTTFVSVKHFTHLCLLFVWIFIFEIVVKFSLARYIMRKVPSLASLGHVRTASSGSSRGWLSGGGSVLTGTSGLQFQLDRDSLNHIKYCQTFIAYGTPSEDSGDPLEERRRNQTRSHVQLLVARVVGPEPNHVATATMAIQAALTMLMERDHLPGPGGVLTPGAAFSETNIIYQLRRRNIKFEVLKKA